MDENMIKAVALAGGGVVIGGVGGYFFAKARLRAKYEAQLENDIKSVKDAYRLLRKEGEYQTPEAAAAAAGIEVVETTETVEKTEYRETLETLEYNPPEETEPSPFVDMSKENPWEPDEAVMARLKEHVESHGGLEPLPNNVFLASELAPVDTPDPDHPYVITIDEFMEDNGYSKNTVTYYEVDDVLVDEREMPIDDIENTVGTRNLDRFGQPGGPSKDANMVHVRNERIDVDFEVLRAKGSYAEMVLGIELEGAASDKSPRKFREDE